MKLGRNEPCHCGSGKKYKHCPPANDESAELDEIERAARRSDYVETLRESRFSHVIDRVRAYNPNRLRRQR